MGRLRQRCACSYCTDRSITQPCPDYSAKVFGFRTFGTVYGTIICLSGLFNFSQSGLDFLFHQTFHGNPVPVNLILMSTGLAIGVCLVLYVGIQARGLQRRLLEQEAEDAFSGRQ